MTLVGQQLPKINPAGNDWGFFTSSVCMHHCYKKINFLKYYKISAYKCQLGNLK